MKKLVCSALIAGSMCVMAEEATCDKCADGACKVAPVAEAAAPEAKPVRQQFTPEQRAEMRARREKFLAERNAAMEAKLLEVVKKYVPDEAQAKALIKELQETMRPGMRRPPMMKKPVEKPAEAAK